jgi:hypothetical protein
MSHLKITGKPPMCVVEVDGKPVDLMSLDLHIDAESLPEAIVRPAVIDVDVETEATVGTDERTAATLLALGWTPPAELQPIRKISYPLADDEIESMRAQGLIDDDGKTVGDRLWEKAFPDGVPEIHE